MDPSNVDFISTWCWELEKARSEEIKRVKKMRRLIKDYLEENYSSQFEDYLDKLFPDPLDDQYKAEMHQILLPDLPKGNPYRNELDIFKETGGEDTIGQRTDKRSPQK